MTLARTNLTLPAELMDQVDRLAGPRGRSKYVAEAVAQRVRRDRLGKAISESAGVMRGTPSQMSRREVTAWINRLRSEESD
jgi:metal-responsive CopG/Arc/MetJ family transcriptional regulator